MEFTYPHPTIRIETAFKRRPPRPASVRQERDCAEELAEVETVVNRAMLLMRSDMKKAA